MVFSDGEVIGFDEGVIPVQLLYRQILSVPDFFVRLWFQCLITYDADVICD